jgi:levansucrase
LIERSSAGLAPASHANAPVSWTAEHVRGIRLDDSSIAPLITERDFVRLDDAIDIWDAWPVQDEDGHPAPIADGTTLWMALAAPHCSDPDARHQHARIHLLERRGSRWRHLGPLMPDRFSPGSREWSGSAVLARDEASLALYFTATGQRGEAAPTFGQRLFLARATLANDAGGRAFVGWHEPAEIVQRDPAHYMATDGEGGAPGTIKAFRDPAFFRDPGNGQRYLFFAASLAHSVSAFNGVVGWAVEQSPGNWAILPPLVSADGLNNELERPHVVFHHGAYYLFWSTQRHVFDPAGPTGPTGLYGMVSDRLERGWRPLNGTGLVFANPPQAPAQAYSWLVLPDLSVTSFVDDWGPAGDGRPRRFGASFAPELQLELDGATARLAG